jgi:hypothetical protein
VPISSTGLSCPLRAMGYVTFHQPCPSPRASELKTYRRINHDNLHVRGYKEEGTTTTPFDMVVLNDLDRYHLVMDVIDRVPGLLCRASHIKQAMRDCRIEHKAYIAEHGEDRPRYETGSGRAPEERHSAYGRTLGRTRPSPCPT